MFSCKSSSHSIKWNVLLRVIISARKKHRERNKNPNKTDMEASRINFQWGSFLIQCISGLLNPVRRSQTRSRCFITQEVLTKRSLLIGSQNCCKIKRITLLFFWYDVPETEVVTYNTTSMQLSSSNTIHQLVRVYESNHSHSITGAAFRTHFSLGPGILFLLHEIRPWFP